MVQTLVQAEKKKSLAGVRALAEGDVPRVADLVWQVLHEREGSAPASLRAYIDELFLRNPWVQDDITPLVYQDAEGKVAGFFGIVPRTMSIQGKTLRLAFGSNFVVEAGSRASFAAMQLVNTFMKGPQDISITDSATEGVRQLFKGLGFNVLPLYSLIWARPLRPSSYALQGVARLKKNKKISALANLVRPFSRIADALATSVRLSPFYQSASPLLAESLDNDALLQCVSRIPAKHWLVPQYTPESLAWVLNFVEKRNAYGNLRKVLLRDDKGKVAGWYIYGLQPGGIGEVLQIGVENAPAGKVLDHLFHDAWQNHLIGLHGRMEPQFMEELTQRSSFFLRNGSWALAHSRTPELLAPAFSGNAFFSRLEGEGCLRYGAGQQPIF
jgi:hypothetical protein